MHVGCGQGNVSQRRHAHGASTHPVVGKAGLSGGALRVAPSASEVETGMAAAAAEPVRVEESHPALRLGSQRVMLAVEDVFIERRVSRNQGSLERGKARISRTVGSPSSTTNSHLLFGQNSDACLLREEVPVFPEFLNAIRHALGDDDHRRHR